MSKPKFIYHGSQYLFDIVQPQQAYGKPEERGDLCGIYGYEFFDWVVPFALPIRWYPDSPFGGKLSFSCNESVVQIDYGSLNPDGVGYIYKLPSDTFELVDDSQWLSLCEVKPLETVEIKVIDFLDRIYLSSRAKQICDELYPLNIYKVRNNLLNF